MRVQLVVPQCLFAFKELIALNTANKGRWLLFGFTLVPLFVSIVQELVSVDSKALRTLYVDNFGVHSELVSLKKTLEDKQFSAFIARHFIDLDVDLHVISKASQRSVWLKMK